MTAGSRSASERRPLLADDAIDHVAGAIGFCPRAERLLNLRVEPLFGGSPSLDYPEVDPSEGGRALKRLKFAEGDAGMVLVHRHQKRTNDTPVQSARPLEELDAVHPGQAKVGCHERHVVALVSQLLEEVEPGLGRARPSPGNRRHTSFGVRVRAPLAPPDCCRSRAEPDP